MERMVDFIRNTRDNNNNMGDANDARRLVYQGILPSKAERVTMTLVDLCYFHVTFSDLVEER